MKKLLLGGLFGVLAAAASAAGATALDDLFSAAQIDNLRDVRRLIQDNVVDPNTVDAKGDTLLIVAIRNDAARVTDYLISSKKVSLNATNAVQETPLMLAAYRSRTDVVTKLLDQGAEVNKPGWTALHYAASAGSVEIVKLLLQHSAAVDSPSPNRTTPLMMAARSNHPDVCRVLVAAGADPTLTNESNLSAADYAQRANDADLNRWLKEQEDAWKARFNGSRPGK